MCEKIKKGMESYHPDHNGVTIIWEIAFPDKVPFEAAQNYLTSYDKIEV